MNDQAPASATASAPATGDFLDVVIVGHVDHGKSTVIGRLLADAGALPEGKLALVRQQCKRSAKPFEYAFLLDALKNERSQGITIDTARCFFNAGGRNYLVHDAPGHIEFLKNMVTGAASAQAALLVIDAREGVRENSRRHGYLLSLLGLGQLAVLVNKMDLVGYAEERFQSIVDEYGAFLGHLGITGVTFIPVSARCGVNLTQRGRETPWYRGPTVLEQLGFFQPPRAPSDLPLRLPVQDVYKFTEHGDDRRIVAGTIETGTLRAGDEVRFYPSRKCARVRRIETLDNSKPAAAKADEAVGVSLEPEIYVKPGEVMARVGEEEPLVGTRLRVNLFWMGSSPLIRGKRYKLKLGGARVAAELVSVEQVLDATELSSIRGKSQVDRHDVAECVLETLRPVACDRLDLLLRMARFVLVDDYDIAGCGVVLALQEQGVSVLEERVRRREYSWETGEITREMRIASYGHAGKFIVFVCPAPGENPSAHARATTFAKALERRLFAGGKHTHFLSIRNVFTDLGVARDQGVVDREEHLLHLGQLARIMTDAGLLFITVLAGADDTDLEKLRVLNEPAELFVVEVGDCELQALTADVSLRSASDLEGGLLQVTRRLSTERVIFDYAI